MNWLYTAIIAFVVGFGAGWKVADWRADSLDAQRAEQQQKIDQKQEAKADEASASHEAARDQIRTEFQVIYRDRDRVVEKPVFRNVCIDPDGLQLISRAINGKTGAGKPPDTLPGTDPAK